MKYYFDSNQWHDEMNSIAQEGGRSHGLLNVGVDDFFGISITIPSLPEQRKIAAILTSVDDAIAKTEAIIKQIEQVKQGLMQQLLTKGMGEIPTEWDVVPLQEVSLKIQDGTHFSPKTVDSGVKYITSKNIRPFKLDLSNISYVTEEAHREIYKRCDVQFGDVLLTKDGVNTGNAVVNYLSEEFSLLSSVCLIRTSDILNNHFLCQYLNSDLCYKWISEQMTGNAIKRLVLNTVKNMPIPLPPMAEQEKISSILSSFDKRIAIESSYVSEIRGVKQALMQSLLTGIVRVKVDEEAEVVS